MFAFSSFNLIQIIYNILQEFHDIEGTSRVEFWNSVADDVNATCSRNYTGLQCQRKFASLTTAYDVSKILKKKDENIYIMYIKFFNTFRTCVCTKRTIREASEVEPAENITTNSIRNFGNCRVNNIRNFSNIYISILT